MLDQSMPTDEGGKSRLANVVSGAQRRDCRRCRRTAAIGLWTFDGKRGQLGGARGPLSDPVDGQPRSAALTSALDVTVRVGRRCGVVHHAAYDLHRRAWRISVRARPIRSWSSPAGPHTDQSLDGAGSAGVHRGAFDPARPVAVNVIDFGADSDRATWEAVAQASGGTYQNLASSAGPELTTAISTFLG